MRKVMLIAVLAIAVMLVASLSPAAGANTKPEPEFMGQGFGGEPEEGQKGPHGYRIGSIISKPALS